MVGGDRKVALTEAAPHVLVVAGTDSSGGAGIARDVETLAAFGVRACLAVSAVTAQTDGRVEHVECMSPGIVEQQMLAALAGGRVRAIKLGMLARPETALAVHNVLSAHPAMPIIVDPVLVSSSGRQLMEGNGIAAYEMLFPLATLLTPNLPELAMLTGCVKACNEDEATDQARQLIEWGARAVLVKGGHAIGREAVDLLVQRNSVSRHSAPRLNVSMRGTGCALASAVAANLALGMELSPSVSVSKTFVLRRMESLQNQFT